VWSHTLWCHHVHFNVLGICSRQSRQWQGAMPNCVAASSKTGGGKMIGPFRPSCSTCQASTANMCLTLENVTAIGVLGTCKAK